MVTYNMRQQTDYAIMHYLERLRNTLIGFSEVLSILNCVFNCNENTRIT